MTEDTTTLPEHDRPVLEVDASLADAINQLSNLVQHGKANLSPESVERIIEVAKQVSAFRSPMSAVAAVAFTLEGARYDIVDDRVWESPTAVTGPSPARAVRFGNTVLHLTIEGHSLLTAFATEEAAQEHLDEITPEIIDPPAPPQPVEMPVMEGTPPPTPPVTGYSAEAGPVFNHEDPTPA